MSINIKKPSLKSCGISIVQTKCQSESKLCWIRNWQLCKRKSICKEVNRVKVKRETTIRCHMERDWESKRNTRWLSFFYWIWNCFLHVSFVSFPNVFSITHLVVWELLFLSTKYPLFDKNWESYIACEIWQ